MESIPIKKSMTDVTREFGRAIVSAIPVAGGPIQVAFENIFTSPLEKRKDAWLNQLAGAINEVQDRVSELTPEKLAENDAFVTVVMQASQIAIRNHQQVKLEALRNIVLNAALPNPPHEDEQLVFLNLIDQFTSWHIRVLSFLNDPIRWVELNNLSKPNWEMGSIANVLEQYMPDLRGKRDMYDQIIFDLQNHGLLTQGHFLHGLMTGSGLASSRTTALGRRFITFISAQ